MKALLITTKKGIPMELCLAPGSEHDIGALRKMYLDLLPESSLYGDSAFTQYELEELYKETELIQLMITRKSNSKKPDQPYQAFFENRYEKKNRNDDK